MSEHQIFKTEHVVKQERKRKSDEISNTDNAAASEDSSSEEVLRNSEGDAYFELSYVVSLTDTRFCFLKLAMTRAVLLLRCRG